jgi:competence protein ComEC
MGPFGRPASVWSVDAIHRETNRCIVRMVKYHDDSERSVGMRYINADLETVAPPSGESVGNLLDFGRSFRVPWKELSQDRTHRLTAKQLSVVERDHGTENALQASIGEHLGRASAFAGAEALPPGGPAEIHVLPVGQGDTIVLRLGPEIFWLIDAYSTRDYDHRVKDALNKLGCKQLQGLVLSHFHYDHIQRAAEVIRDFEPEQILVPRYEHRTSSTIRALARAGDRLHRLDAAANMTIGALTITFAPTEEFARSSDPNEHAILCYCQSPSATALLAADVPAATLNAAIQKFGWTFLPKKGGMFYKVTHHCSETGRDRSLLALMNPRMAVTSCGLGNRCGHPEPSTRKLVDDIAKIHRVTCEVAPKPFPLV